MCRSSPKKFIEAVLNNPLATRRNNKGYRDIYTFKTSYITFCSIFNYIQLETISYHTPTFPNHYIYNRNSHPTLTPLFSIIL